MLTALTALAQQPAQPPVPEITKIAGEVYRFRNNNHYSVFAVDFIPLNVEGMYRYMLVYRRPN